MTPPVPQADVHRVLVGARLRVERGWTQRSFRRWRLFRPTLMCSGEAIHVEAKRLHRWDREQAFAVECAAKFVLLGVVGGGTVPNWNDGSTKAQVLAGFDKAIACVAPAPVDPLADVELPAEVFA